VPTAALSDILISPSITITESYNSNPLSRSTDQHVDDDYITTVSPKIRLKNKKKGYSLDMSYQMSSTYYREEPANNDISHRATAGIRARITKRTSVNLQDAFTATKDTLSATDEGIQTARDDITYNRVSLNIDHALSPETSITLGAALSRSDFDNPALFDTRRESASIGATYRLSEKRSTTTTYTFSNYLSDTAGRTDHNETHTLKVGLKEDLSATLALNLSGGLVYTPSISEDYDWIATAKLAKSLKNLSATIGYTRSISNFSGLSRDINVNDRVNIGLNHSLSESIGLALSGGITKSHSKPSGTIDLDSYSADLSVSWQPYPWIATAIGYSFFKQSSGNATTFNIDRERAYLSLTLTPHQWRL
jgi:hypothetical protein